MSVNICSFDKWLRAGKSRLKDASEESPEIRHYRYSIVMNAVARKMEEIGASPDLANRSFYALRGRGLSIVMSDRPNEIAQGNLSVWNNGYGTTNMIAVLRNLADVQEFVDVCADHLEGKIVLKSEAMERPWWNRDGERLK